MTENLTDEQKEQLAQRIADAMERVPFKTDRCGVQSAVLPFYKNARKVDIECFTTRPVITKEYVCGDAGVFEIDGEKETLEDMNAAFSLNLTDGNVVDYLRFYFDAVALEDDFAKLIVKADDLINDAYDDELADSLKKLIEAPAVSKTAKGWTVKGYVAYGDALYSAEFSVATDGGVRIEDEQTAYENLPVRPMLR